MINLSVPETEFEMRPRITVFGVGGAGGNAVNNMIRSNLEGVEFVVANTDAQALKGSLAHKRVQLGATLTRGLGAGSRPDVGRAAAEEQIDEILAHLQGANMCFITAGMGGGTGTGAAAVIARAAREQGILTVGVVTKPFHFEGAHRMRLAESGISELQQYVDTLIIIPNQNLFRIANEKTTFADAFKMADDVLHAGVSGVTDLMIKPGLINLDFADIRSVMTEMGKAMMGTGEATGERRAIEAAEAAINNPLLEDVSMKGARGVLINITGGMDMTLFEVDEAANRIRDEVDPDANIIFGSTFDESMEGIMRVSVVATGIETEKAVQPRPAQPTLQVVGGNRRPAAAPVRMEPAPVRSSGTGVDYHHTLSPAPVAPMQTTSLHGSAVRKPEPHQAEIHAPLEEAEPAAVAHHTIAEAPSAATAPVAAPAPQPMGPLRGERREDAFIPPQPAEAGLRLPAANPDRFTAPVQAEISQQPRRGSLFNRMMGFARGEMRETAPAVREPAAPSLGPVRMGQPMHTQTGAPAAKAASADEDMLDIPAFLRRQAN